MYGGTQLGGLDLICQGLIAVNSDGGNGSLIAIRGIDASSLVVLVPGCSWEIKLAPLGWGIGIGGGMGEEIPHLFPSLTYLANPGGAGVVPRFYTSTSGADDMVRLSLVGPDLKTPTPDPDFGVVLWFSVFYTPATAGPSFALPLP